MALDICEHIRLGRRGKTTNLRQRLITGVHPDEAGDIQVVWPKVATPFRQAMRLIENPGTDLTLADRSPESLVAELLGRYQQNADIAHLDFLQYLGALRHRQQAIQRCGALDVTFQQPVDLILHQRLQRRDDDGKAAVTMKPVQRRQLIAQRLAPAGRQDGQDVLTTHAGQHYIVLETLSRTLVTKIGKPK